MGGTNKAPSFKFRKFNNALGIVGNKEQLSNCRLSNYEQASLVRYALPIRWCTLCMLSNLVMYIRRR